MTHKTIAPQIRVGGFDTVAEADRAIRRLLANGFSKDQLAVILRKAVRGHDQSAALIAGERRDRRFDVGGLTNLRID